MSRLSYTRVLMNLSKNNGTHSDISYLARTGDHNVDFNDGHYPIKLPKLTEKFTDRLLDAMVEKGLTKQRSPDLVSLHQYVKHSDQLERDGRIKKATEIMDSPDAALRSYFFQIIKEIRKTIGIDFNFPKYPSFRFHFPGPTHKDFITTDGQSLWIHNDVILGHPFEIINCWLALTDCEKTNTLYIGNLSGSLEVLRKFCSHYNLSEDEFYLSRPKFRDLMERDRSFLDLVYRHCEPRTFQKGDLLLFDPRCIHGPVENTETNTRVSMDFRLITPSDFGKVEKYQNPQVREVLLSKTH